MDSTVVLTGILPAVMLTSAGLTAVVSIFLLWLYRKAVLRSMRATTGSIDIGIPSNEAATRSTGNAPDLTIATIEVKRLPDKSLAAAAAFRQATQSLRRSTLIYAVGGLLYVAIDRSVEMGLWYSVVTGLARGALVGGIALAVSLGLELWGLRRRR